MRQPKVSLWFVAMRYNVEELPELVELAPEAGASAFHIETFVSERMLCR